MENKLMGVVLCGGESKRMGKDKGLLLKDEQPWAVIIADKLAQHGLEVAVSVNELQKQSYRNIFPERTLIVDHIPISGPLNGLLSVHQRFPDHDLLLMACDLTEMDKDTLDTLIGAYREQPGHEFYVYRHNGFAEPFCAIYTAAALAAVLQQQESGELRRYSLHERFETGNTLYLTIDDLSVFKNFNHPV
ncbi:MAG TPA: molybdenum cofactor guanylyltransferase [Pedobacter sp.]|uniref:molybdenum cofactor guanylyltransferase n=1 Tax=Pedobacter sp. TaxID=1411316 RepID=UPI002C4DBBAB|nr:molybdenum cofactor guanylyltransferase [Pedobacter sp.]HMI03867.1 molybdenum cofactor guanylyltransferase [Pedobacter sp.]